MFLLLKFICFFRGLMLLCDSFGSSHFKQSYQKIFARDENDQLEMAFNAEVEVKVSCSLTLLFFHF